MTDAPAPRGAAPRPPAIISVDDDPQVLDAIVTDLRSRYGSRYRVVGAPSGESALGAARRLKRRGDDLALVVADQRMPGLTGTDLLVEVKRVFPDIKTVLLTAYADTDAAITAINDIHLDHYVMKPWDPPEDRLYPILDELLEEWTATRPPPETGLRLVGDRWSAASHRLRDYLARNLVPFRWLDLDEPSAAAPMLAAAGDAQLPLMILEDGRTLSDPALGEVAEVLGLSARPAVEFYDLVVVGAGPAGLAAAVYGGSEGLSTIVVEAEAPGGQAGLSSRIENYLGFPNGISGAELTRRARDQARKFHTTMLSPHPAVGLRRADPYRVVTLGDGTELHCSTVILATGVQYNRLDLDGADALTGAGIYYGAASTEAPAMAGQRVVVVGGANAAGQAAVHLARYADDVVVVVRAASLGARMSRYLVDQIERTASITVRVCSRIGAVHGTSRLERVTICDGDGTDEELDAAGMFVFIGARPRTDWLEGVVARDDQGFVLTGAALTPERWALERDPFLLETSVPGVFAVGDVRARSVKRIASAVGEGAIAVQLVHEILRGA